MIIESRPYRSSGRDAAGAVLMMLRKVIVMTRFVVLDLPRDSLYFDIRAPLRYFILSIDVA